MEDFLFIKERTNKLDLRSSFISFIYSYSLVTHLGIDFFGGSQLEGYIINTHHKQWDKPAGRFNCKVLGLEGLDSWQYLNSHRGNFPEKIVSPGINLNLAVAIHNIKRILESMKSIYPKTKLALTNVDTENGEEISEIFTNIFGNIILVGENQEQLRVLSQKLFNNYGVMVSFFAHLPTNKNILVIDIKVIKKYVAEMNFFGEYREIQGRHNKDFVFSAFFVEMLVVCSGIIDLNQYNPIKINTNNVTAIAKSAKKLGFVPLFSTIQKSFLEHNNVTSSDV